MIGLWDIAQAASEAVLYEVTATPKPGLVDRLSNGAHKDMDFFTFMASEAAVSPYFYTFASYGYESCGQEPTAVFAEARRIGLEAEEAMLRATHGVNTHKGMIFSMGLACLACGRILGNHKKLSTNAVSSCIMEFTAGLCERDFKQKPSTNGERLHQTHRIRGARGEAEDGFPTVCELALPELERRLDEGLSVNEALVRTLLLIMERTVDTNVIHRRGIEEAEWLMKTAGAYKDAPLSDIERLDGILIEKNISAGGCADLLALTWFFYRIKKFK